MEKQDVWKKREWHYSQKNNTALASAMLWSFVWIFLGGLIGSKATGWPDGFRLVSLGAIAALVLYGWMWFFRIHGMVDRELLILKAEKRHIHEPYCAERGPIAVLNAKYVYTGDTWGDTHRLVYLRAQCLVCGSVTVYDMHHGVQLEE